MKAEIKFEIADKYKHLAKESLIKLIETKFNV